MPELPEVEIVRKSLDKKIQKKMIKKVLVRNRNLRFRIPLNFEHFLEGQKILKVNRFSKYLIFNLSNQSFCLLHLGMSGTVHAVHSDKKNFITNTSFYNSPKLPKKHNHVEIFFDNLKIVYNDPRRFGFFQIIENKEFLKKRFNHLGLEPFDQNFTTEYVYNFFKKKDKNIKNFLIDQNFVSGVGNIYASEILFLSRINPEKKGKKLSKNECRNIVINSKKVLKNAIRKGGSSIRDFRNTDGYQGNFQNNFKVYQREGLNCKRKKCTSIIKRKIINNRSTFFCSICQK